MLDEKVSTLKRLAYQALKGNPFFFEVYLENESTMKDVYLLQNGISYNEFDKSENALRNRICGLELTLKIYLDVDYFPLAMKYNPSFKNQDLPFETSCLAYTCESYQWPTMRSDFKIIDLFD